MNLNLKLKADQLELNAKFQEKHALDNSSGCRMVVCSINLYGAIMFNFPRKGCSFTGPYDFVGHTLAS